MRTGVTTATVLYLSLLPVAIECCLQEATISTEKGNITGCTIYKNSTVYHFYGIPYAKPPTGNLRWQKPVPADSWTGTFRAESKGEMGIACIQKLTSSRKTYNTSENCLQLNIYTPNIPASSNNKAVMFFIHGGGFTKGAAREYEGEHLANEGDIVLVTVNYRLSIFGFFDSDNDDIWENLGLWDIKLALEWVQENIGYFGGNKSRVTVFGGSAGGMISTLLASSVSFQGLFHRIISQSGTHICPKLIKRSTTKIHEKVLKEIGCESAACLKEKPADEIIKVAAKLDGQEFTFPTLYTFAAYPDDEILSADQFEVFRFYRDGSKVSDEKRLKIISLFQQYDLMAGFNTQEGTLIQTTLSKLAKQQGFTLSDGANDIIADIFYNDYLPAYFPLTSRTKLEDFKKIFFSDVRLETDPNSEVAQTLMTTYTDLLFGAPALTLLDRHSSNGNGSTYLYTFNHMTEESRKLSPDWFRGSRHTEERVFLFGAWPSFFKSARGELVMTDEDKKLSKDMMTAWSNFAKTGNPNGEKLGSVWRPYSRVHQNYMGFGSDSVDVSSRLYNMRRVQAMQDSLKSNSPTQSPTDTTTSAASASLDSSVLFVLLLTAIALE